MLERHKRYSAHSLWRASALKGSVHQILIVDDDPQIRAGLTALLEDDWEVRSADTGRAALAAFAEFSPDVVLLDVNLPDATGIELLNQFKMYSEASAVIMMSGQGTWYPTDERFGWAERGDRAGFRGASLRRRPLPRGPAHYSPLRARPCRPG